MLRRAQHPEPPDGHLGFGRRLFQEPDEGPVSRPGPLLVVQRRVGFEDDARPGVVRQLAQHHGERLDGPARQVVQGAPGRAEPQVGAARRDGDRRAEVAAAARPSQFGVQALAAVPPVFQQPVDLALRGAGQPGEAVTGPGGQPQRQHVGGRAGRPPGRGARTSVDREAQQRLVRPRRAAHEGGDRGDDERAAAHPGTVGGRPQRFPAGGRQAAGRAGAGVAEHRPVSRHGGRLRAVREVLVPVAAVGLVLRRLLVGGFLLPQLPQRGVSGRAVRLTAQGRAVESGDTAGQQGAAEVVDQQLVVALVPDVPVRCQLEEDVRGEVPFGGVGRVPAVRAHQRLRRLPRFPLVGEVDVPQRDRLTGRPDHLHRGAAVLREPQPERLGLGDGLPQRPPEEVRVERAQDIGVLPDVVLPGRVLRALGQPRPLLASGQGRSELCLAFHVSPFDGQPDARFCLPRHRGGRPPRWRVVPVYAAAEGPPVSGRRFSGRRFSSCRFSGRRLSGCRGPDRWCATPRRPGRRRRRRARSRRRRPCRPASSAAQTPAAGDPPRGRARPGRARCH